MRSVRYNELCGELLQNVDNSLAVAWADLNSGSLLAVQHNVPYFTQEYLDAVTASAVAMFRGKLITYVEQLLAEKRGDKEIKRSLKEVQMTTDYTYHFLSVVPSSPDDLLILVTTKNVNLERAWNAVRNSLEEVSKK